MCGLQFSFYGFTFRDPLVVEIVGQQPLFKEQLELSEASGDLLLGELGLSGRVNRRSDGRGLFGRGSNASGAWAEARRRD